MMLLCSPFLVLVFATTICLGDMALLDPQRGRWRHRHEVKRYRGTAAALGLASVDDLVVRMQLGAESSKNPRQSLASTATEGSDELTSLLAKILKRTDVPVIARRRSRTGTTTTTQVLSDLHTITSQALLPELSSLANLPELPELPKLPILPSLPGTAAPSSTKPGEPSEGEPTATDGPATPISSERFESSPSKLRSPRGPGSATAARAGGRSARAAGSQGIEDTASTASDTEIDARASGRSDPRGGKQQDRLRDSSPSEASKRTPGRAKRGKGGEPASASAKSGKQQRMSPLTRGQAVSANDRSQSKSRTDSQAGKEGQSRDSAIPAQASPSAPVPGERQKGGAKESRSQSRARITRKQEREPSQAAGLGPLTPGYPDNRLTSAGSSRLAPETSGLTPPVPPVKIPKPALVPITSEPSSNWYEDGQDASRGLRDLSDEATEAVAGALRHLRLKLTSLLREPEEEVGDNTAVTFYVPVDENGYAAPSGAWGDAYAQVIPTDPEPAKQHREKKGEQGTRRPMASAENSGDSDKGFAKFGARGQGKQKSDRLRVFSADREGAIGKTITAVARRGQPE